ncbi:hypothetical protein P6144_19965 [Sphingomonas sp. HITSZ_GF]|uniref:hypothetical protein n=1 Tax=Sphingomonas sp. HITSZ_GF TaxID=3037247 RepID=UPI00240E8924|nr:hypothetical protein [Sphingomonas sp. HITSZ_GF]MDG2535947.1 hypothetical protein [Sphingomonas sp. HITSZ_GF]
MIGFGLSRRQKGAIALPPIAPIQSEMISADCLHFAAADRPFIGPFPPQSLGTASRYH